MMRSLEIEFDPVKDRINREKHGSDLVLRR